MLAVTLRASYRTTTARGSRAASRIVEAEMRKFVCLAAMTLASASVPRAVSAQIDSQRDDRVQVSPDAPPVDLWLDQISFDYGARMRPHVVTDPARMSWC